MLGPIGSTLMQILRVLTPSEIERYITRSDRARPVQLMAAGAENIGTDGRESHGDDEYRNQLEKKSKEKLSLVKDESETEDSNENELGKAKIIPLRPTDEHSGKPQNDQSKNLDDNSNERIEFSKNPEKSSALEGMGILSREKIKNLKDKKIAEERNSQDSTTVFILNERKRLEESRQKLVCQQGVNSYRKNLSNDHLVVREITDDNIDEELNNNSVSSGILVNKKQA